MTVPLAPALVLIVDDEMQIRRFLSHALTAAGYQVLVAETGAEALIIARNQSLNLMILDLGLPDMDGKTVIETVRKDSDLPIIVLSAQTQEMEKIMALDLGADDFVMKPFAIGELLARLRVCLRPRNRRDKPDDVLNWPNLKIDLAAHQVQVNGQPVKLTPKEFDLLVMLAENPGRVLTHHQILAHIWGPAHIEDVAYLRVFIGQLRKKLTLPSGGSNWIHTEPGIGYRWINDDTYPI